MEWAEMYERFVRDANDPCAWGSLQQRVHCWATHEFGSGDWAAVKDAVADTCSTAVLSIGKAHGATTFAGFTRACFLTVRQQMLRTRQQLVVSLDEGDATAAISDDSDAPDPDEMAALRAALAALPRESGGRSSCASSKTAPPPRSVVSSA